MFLIKDAFATVWNTEDKGNYVQGRISTSEKDKKEDGKYINSNWFCRFVGTAKEKSTTLKERDRIKILSGKITNIVSGEGDNKKTYLNVIIFDFEMLNSAGYTKPVSPEVEDDDLPF